MVTITAVTPGTPAAKKGIQSGDVLLSVNGHEIHDVLDYRFYLTEKQLTLLLHRGPELLTDNRALYLRALPPPVLQTR